MNMKICEKMKGGFSLRASLPLLSFVCKEERQQQTQSNDANVRVYVFHLFYLILQQTKVLLWN